MNFKEGSTGSGRIKNDNIYVPRDVVEISGLLRKLDRDNRIVKDALTDALRKELCFKQDTNELSWYDRTDPWSRSWERYVPDPSY